MNIKYNQLCIRNAEKKDCEQLAVWWNDGTVMAHAGFPNGLGTSAAEIEKQIADDSDSSTDTSSDDSTESKESRLTVISAGSLIDQQITDAFSQLENTQVFMNAVTANFEGVTNLSIEAKSLTTEYNTVQHAGGFSILVVFGIPAVVLIGGFVVWFRRRKA